MSAMMEVSRPRDYYESGSSEEISQQDIDKIQTLWSDIKDNRRNVESLQNTYNKGASTSSLGHYISENQDLRERLRQSEKELNDARDNIVILSRKVNEAESGIELYNTHLNKQTDINAMKTHQINRMTTQYENLNLSQKEIIERTRESNLALIHELDERNKELQNTKNLSNQRVEKLSVASVSYNQASAKIERLEDDLDDKRREISTLKKELDEARKTIQELQQIKKSEGLAILEIEHLRADNQRLVKMLKTTKEYQEFADFADDNSGSIRFFKDSLKQTNVDSTYKRLNAGQSASESVIQRLCVQESQLDEKEMWMPNDAFKFAKEFRRTYNGELTDALLDKLLFELNRIWSKRENQRVQRVQAQCAHEIMKLKRKLGQSAPFNEVQAKQTINRLRNELKTSYKENRKAFDERMEKNPPGIHYVNETMKMVKDTMRVKKQLTQENNFLRDKYKTFSLSKSQSGWARGKGNKILKRVL